MADSIFTDQTPAVTDANDSVPLSLGTKWFATVAGTVTHGRWFFPDTAPSGPVDWVLYDEVTETELARATFADTGPGWRTVALDPPVAYTTPTAAMVAAVETPDRYVATINFFSSAVTNGALTAPADGDNGRVSSGAVYPSSSFNDACYFPDVVFVAAAGSVTPDGVAVSVGLGEPTVAEVEVGDVVPDGVAVSVALGEPSLAWSGAVFPTSVAVSAAAGDAAVGQALSVVPDGVAAPVTLGSPTVGAELAPVAGPAYVRDTTDV